MSSSELRQRGAAGQPAASARSKAALSSGGNGLPGADPADDEPRVAAAASAFDDDSNGAVAPPAAPGVQRMLEEDGGDDDNTAGGVVAPPPVPNNGSRLNLPPTLREAFEKRKAELLKQHPDMLHRDISNDIGAPPGSVIGSFLPRFDHLVLLLLLAVAIGLLYVEYDIDVLGWIGDAVRGALDPGPIQRGEETQGDNPAGRAAMEAALERARRTVMAAAQAAQENAKR